MAANRRKDVADEKEILEFLTDIMRSDEAKPSETTKAAELIGKHYGMFSDKQGAKDAKEVPDVIIIDDIPDA